MSWKSYHILLRVELVLLERLNELGRQTESPQAETALGAAADIVDQSHCPLVHLLLVEKLVLDHVHVHKVAHVGAGVPPDIVGVDVDFAHHSDHLGLVSGVRLDAGSGSGRVGSGVVEVRFGGHLDHGEWERVGDLEGTLDVHTDEGASRVRREGLRAVLDDFHHHLERRA